MVLAMALLFTAVPEGVLANSQSPINEIVDVTIKHTKISATNNILPSIALTFMKPAPAVEQGRPTHEPENYIVTSKAYKATVPGEQKKTVAATGNQITVGLDGLKNGVLYETTVQATHQEPFNDGTGKFYTMTSPVTERSTAYYITDFDTQIDGGANYIDINWEYIPDVDYEIYYAQGNYDSIDAFPKDGVNKVNLTSKEAITRTKLDSKTGQERIHFKITDNIVPGQMYSAYIFPKIKEGPLVSKKVYTNEIDPKIGTGITKIKLDGYDIGKGRMRLEWNIEPSVVSGKEYQLVEAKLYGTPLGGVPGLIYTFKGKTASDLGYYELQAPTIKTSFHIEFTFKNPNDGTTLIPQPQTEIFEYTPYEMREKPLQPSIPKPAGKNIKFTDENINEYVVKGDDIPYNGENMLANTFHVNNLDPLTIQLAWGAPIKPGTTQVEYSMAYDIWIAESKDQFKLAPLYENIQIVEDVKENLIYKQNGKTVVGFKKTFEQYYNANEEKVNLVPNKTYYIKMVAKRYGNEDPKSDPAIVAITLDKNGDIFAPPVLGKPPLQLQEGSIKTNEVTIEWLEEWHEITAKDPQRYPVAEQFLAGLWNSIVYTPQKGANVTTSPAIRFEPQVNFEPQILKQKKDVERVKNIVNDIMNASGYPKDKYYDDSYDARTMKLGEDSQYQVKTIPFDEMNQEMEAYNEKTGNKLTIEKWIAEEEGKKTEGWQAVTPGSRADAVENLTWQTHTVSGLVENTRYVVMIRAYRDVPGGKREIQTYPSYIICTTRSGHIPPEETPKVPILYKDESKRSDTTLGVKWIYNENFEYELRYSRTDDPEKAEVIEFKLSNNPNDPNYVGDGKYAYVSIKGLFPGTSYNTWIRAKQKTGKEVSAWSNPVTQTTDQVKAPAPPTGLGPASYQSILELGKDFPAIGKDYMTVEWVKNSNDKGKEEEDTLSREYQYVLEFADNVEFMDALEVVVKDGKGESEGEKTAEILAKNMVKFNGLIANRPYYVRVKTRMVLKDSESKKEIVRDSEFTKFVRILTKKSDDEYDGGDNGNVVIYPEAIREEYSNGTWTWEVVDAQTIISQIINKKAYYFEVKMEQYGKRYDATTRKIRLPKPLVDAMIGQKTELRVTTNKGIYEIPMTAVSYYTAKGSASDIVEFEFKSLLPSDLSSIEKKYPYQLMVAERLQVGMHSKKVYTEPLTKLDGTMKVKLKLNSAESYLYSNTVPYTYDYLVGDWIKESYAIDTTLKQPYMTYPTSRLGIYSVYQVKNYAPSHNMTPSMESILSKYNVEGLGITYKKNDTVSSSQYINLLIGIAENSSSINLGAGVSGDMRNKASRSGIYTSNNGGTINQEEAISGLVRVYELKNGYKVKPSAVRFTNVGNSYRENISKAYALGLITDIMPKAKVTYGELCEWIEQILP